MSLLPNVTSAEVASLLTRTAVLPVGSYEQHGSFHPLVTDTIVAVAIAKRISQDYGLFELPPITFSCSQEHAQFAGSVSISASTLIVVIRDIAASLEQQGFSHLVVVNGHGGNYVLKNIVQEANIGGPRTTLFPGADDWDQGRRDADMVTSSSDDMHAGELETSLLLHVAPEALRDGYETADSEAPDRPHLLVLGMAAYTKNGVIGRPSLGTAAKGRQLLDSLSKSFTGHLDAAGLLPEGR